MSKGKEKVKYWKKNIPILNKRSKKRKNKWLYHPKVMKNLGLMDDLIVMDHTLQEIV